MADLVCWCYYCNADAEWEWHKNWEKYECFNCGTLERSDWPSISRVVRGEKGENG